jgi:hypothetical protein
VDCPLDQTLKITKRTDHLAEKELAKETEVMDENLSQYHFLYLRSHKDWPRIES